MADPQHASRKVLISMAPHQIENLVEFSFLRCDCGSFMAAFIGRKVVNISGYVAEAMGRQKVNLDADRTRRAKLAAIA